MIKEGVWEQLTASGTLLNTVMPPALFIACSLQGALHSLGGPGMCLHVAAEFGGADPVRGNKW